MKKFELTNETIIKFGRTLYRIKALISFGTVRAGDLGGYVEKEENLSQSGNAWVSCNAKVSGNARVSDNAWVSGNACVIGNAQVRGNAQVIGNAQVRGNAQVSGNAWVSCNAWVDGSARVSGSALVDGYARVSCDAEIIKSTHYLTIGFIGSRNDTTTFFRTKYKEINVKCGCFLGSILDFRLKVKETHASNKHEKVYELACQLAEAQIDLSDNVSI